MATKQLVFDEAARQALLRGVQKLSRAVKATLGITRADLVLSDMAPNLSGIDSVDQAKSVHLAELALEFASSFLQPGGDFVVKLFQGVGLTEFEPAVSQHFAKTYLRKPKASRDRSREIFVVAKRRLA